jgi:hypothetical protein
MNKGRRQAFSGDIRGKLPSNIKKRGGTINAPPLI